MDQIGSLATRLRGMLDRGNCIAWIGSGLSMPAGYPGWEETVAKLCRACNVLKPEAYLPCGPTELAALAEQCKAANPLAYGQILADTFGKPVVTDRRAYHLLAKLRFKAYITTNYDPLLRDAIHAEGRAFFQYPVLHAGSIERRESTAFYIHGLARDDDNNACGRDLVLAESEFREAYEDPAVVASFVQSVLLAYDLVFVGCSLEEPAIQACLVRMKRAHDLIKARHPSAPVPQRVLLLPRRYRCERELGRDRRLHDGSVERNEHIRFAAMGIEILRYETDADDNHVAIERALERALVISGALSPPGPELTI